MMRELDRKSNTFFCQIPSSGQSSSITPHQFQSLLPLKKIHRLNSLPKHNSCKENNNSNKMMQQEAALETLTVLRQQESRYVTQDALRPAGPLEWKCRAKMAAWCFHIAKICEFQPESVEIALSCLDRFLTTEQGTAALQDRSIYQLASMVCLYTAVKVHESAAISPAIVCTLARDAYTPSQVEEMERTILTALEWRVNPPTMASFARLGVDLISQQTKLTGKQRSTVVDLCSYQLEVAVREYRFMTVDRSIVAYCAIMNGLEAVMGVPVSRELGTALAQVMQLDSCHDVIKGVSCSLYETVVDHEAEFAMFRPTTPAQQPSDTTAPAHCRGASLEASPRTVTNANTSANT
jgi:hypothetical protein